MLCLLSDCSRCSLRGRRHHGGAGPDPHHRRRATGVLRAVAARLLAGLYMERAGVFDTGLEGKILAGTFAGASAGYRLGPARPGRRRSHRRVFRAGARFRLDHPSRRPDRLRCRHQISSLPAPHHSRPGLVPAGRARGRSPKTRDSRRSLCPTPKRCAACRCSGRSILS